MIVPSKTGPILGLEAERGLESQQRGTKRGAPIWLEVLEVLGEGKLSGPQRRLKFQEEGILGPHPAQQIFLVST